MSSISSFVVRLDSVTIKLVFCVKDTLIFSHKNILFEYP